MSITSLTLAKAHLNIGHDLDDEIIELYIEAAEQYLSNYIGRDFTQITPFPVDLKLAVLRLVAFNYQNRESVVIGLTGMLCPYPVTQAADPYREMWFGGDSNG